MTQTMPPPQTPPTPAPAPRRWWTFGWRLAASMAIVVAAVVLVGMLGHPNRGKGREDAGLWQKSATPVAPSELSSARPETALTPQQKEAWAHANLRSVLGGILMRAAESPSYDEDPMSLPPDERRRFLAEQFHLPYDYPRSEVPAGVVPQEAEVMMVFGHPEVETTRMIMTRVKGGLETAMTAFQALYAKEGWESSEPEANKREGGGSRTVTDKGWLVRYSRGKEVRFVYFEKRESRDETLAMVYDSKD